MTQKIFILRAKLRKVIVLLTTLSQKEVEEMDTYDGVYMMNFRGGKMLKSHLGTISKLQWPKLFMKSM